MKYGSLFVKMITAMSERKEEVPGGEKLREKSCSTRTNCSRFPGQIEAVGKALQRINIGKWIRDLEHQQEFSNTLNHMKRRNHAEEACLERSRRKQFDDGREAIQAHLISFLEDFPQGSYRDWIRNLQQVKEDKEPYTFKKTLDLSENDRLLLWENAQFEKWQREDSLYEEDL